jgi:hypothetical protein
MNQPVRRPAPHTDISVAPSAGAEGCLIRTVQGARVENVEKKVTRIEVTTRGR